MSVFEVYMKDGVKHMRSIASREDYLKLRDSKEQKATLKTVREGEHQKKCLLVQMNYSCLPNEDGTLKGSKTASMSVGMDIDFVAPSDLSDEAKKAWLQEKMAGVPMVYVHIVVVL